MNVERVKTALHEAGHATMALKLGGRLTGPVSIRPTRNWAGVCFALGPYYPPRDRDRARFGGPIVNLPPSVRRSREIECMITLAGPECERFTPVDGYMAVSDPAHDEQAVAVLAPLTRRDAKFLALGNTEDHDHDTTNDVEAAFREAELLAGPGARGGALLEFLRLETVDLIAKSYFQKPLHAITAALVEHESLSARTVRAIFLETTEATT